MEGLHSQVRIVEALAKSPDLITYLPPKLHGPWPNEMEAETEATALPFIPKARELNVATTVLYTGVFDYTYFTQGQVFHETDKDSAPTPG